MAYGRLQCVASILLLLYPYSWQKEVVYWGAGCVLVCLSFASIPELEHATCFDRFAELVGWKGSFPAVCPGFRICLFLIRSYVSDLKRVSVSPEWSMRRKTTCVHHQCALRSKTQESPGKPRLALLYLGGQNKCMSIHCWWLFYVVESGMHSCMAICVILGCIHIHT